MYEIPKPQLLDPDRIDRDDREELTAEDHRSRAQLFATALAETCHYADQLWNQVNALRGYLLDSIPPDPRKPGAHTRTSASPTGPDDEQGWQNWIEAFATTSSVLCGAHGDSGFGLSRAREEAQLRRTAPELTLHARHPEPAADQQPPAHPAPPQRQARNGQAHSSSSWSPIKVAAATVVAVLTLRGLRPRPSHRTRG
jgi:hypothetical protein